MHNKYQAMAAKFYHTLYRTNFYKTSNETQRQWTNAMKDFIDEVRTGRDPREGIATED